MKMSLPTPDLCQVRFKSFSSNETATGKYISLKRGSSMGFSGSGISLVWSSGFGILKQNSGEIRDWKNVQEVGYQNNPRDYGIAWNFGSGLRDWRTLLGTLWGYRMYGRRTLPSLFGNGKVTVIHRETDIYIGQICRKYKATDLQGDRYIQGCYIQVWLYFR